MPSRILRDGIIDSKAVNSLNDSGEILYRRLMSVVDDYGRFEADHELIRVRCFGRQLDRWPVLRVADALANTTAVTFDDGVPLVLLYQNGSKRYLQINNFGQRERAKSKFPEPTVRQFQDSLRRMAADGGEPPQLAAVGGGSPQPAADCGGIRELAKPASVEAENAKSPPYSYSESYSDSRADSDSDSDSVAIAPLLPFPVSLDQLIGEAAERMYSRHPKKKLMALVPDALRKAAIATPDPQAALIEIESCHAAWVLDPDWTKKNGDYAPKLAEWIADQGYTAWPTCDIRAPDIRDRNIIANLKAIEEDDRRRGFND